MAVYFNGVNSNITVKDNPTIQFTDEITMVCRINPYYTPTNKFTDVIKKSYWTGTTDAGYILRIDIGGYPKIILGNEDTGWWGKLGYTDPISMGREHFLAGGYDGENIFIYVDGTLQTLADAGNSIKSTGQDLLINAQSTLRGELHELMLFNRALSKDELDKLMYHGEFDNTGLACWYKYNEKDGVVCKDYSGHGNDGIMANCKYISTSRKGIYYNGDRVYAAYGTGWNFDPTKEVVTIIFIGTTLDERSTTWTVKGRHKLFGWNGDSFMLYVDPWSFNPILSTYDTVTNTWPATALNKRLECGKIYSIVGIANSNVREIRTYSNGKLIASNSRSDINAGAIAWSPNNISKDSYPLHGIVVACLAYNRVLTDEELRYISDGGWNDPPRDGLKVYIRFDKKKEGDKDYDEITGAEASYVNGTPTFVIRKPVR